MKKLKLVHSRRGLFFRWENPAPTGDPLQKTVDWVMLITFVGWVLWMLSVFVRAGAYYFGGS